MDKRSFHRDNPLFSLCGLNCGLCQMYVGRYCPGCGGGNPACAVARCAEAHGGVSYCFECGEYPCARYAEPDAFDSVVPCIHRLRDMARAKDVGAEAYTAELRERMDALQILLDGYNDGRRKSLFLTAVYLLEPDDVRNVLKALPSLDTPLPERAAAAAALLQAAAKERGVDCRLRKKPKKT